MKEIVLKRGRDKSLARRHPWIFSGAIERTSGDAEPGETMAVRSAEGRFLAYAAFSPRSQIRARAWSFDEAASIDAAFMKASVQRAIAFRTRAVAADTDACRLVHGESDALPGLVIDRFQAYGQTHTTANDPFLEGGRPATVIFP